MERYWMTRKDQVHPWLFNKCRKGLFLHMDDIISGVKQASVQNTGQSGRHSSTPTFRTDSCPHIKHSELTTRFNHLYRQVIHNVTKQNSSVHHIGTKVVYSCDFYQRRRLKYYLFYPSIPSRAQGHWGSAGAYLSCRRSKVE